ncbi:MAG TPA: ABC transporter ATP-binding protein/permease [Candidatus Onthoplasma faecipullorum]|nr:ABC transporter ATP-binding protein/permease [Candidatus Onthoplasma faecipullorum]
MFKLIFKQLKKKEWLLMVLIVALICGQVYLELLIPDYMSEITRLVQVETGTLNGILIAGAKMLVCAITSTILASVTGFIVARISSSVSMRLRSEIFSKVQSFSTNEIKKFSTASLITRSTNDITQIQNFFVMGLSALIRAPIMAIWAIVKISGKSYQWSIATLVAVLVLFVAVITITSFVIPKFRKMQTLTDNLNRITRENLIGLKVVRAYNAENYQEDKFNRANDELTNTNMSAHRMLSVMSPLMSAVMSGLPLAIYWIGAYLINRAGVVDKLTIFSDMVVFSSYAIQIVMSFVMLVMVFIMLPRASVSARRISEVLNTNSSIVSGAGVVVQEKDKGTVEFKSVSFKYPDADEYILQNVNFKVKKGETIAFIGSTGSGKSTLINLVPRFYDVTEGEVLVDGNDVRDFDLTDLRDRIGYVSQRAVLFSGSVLSNVAFGGGEVKPDEESVEKAIDISQSAEFVSKMEYGLNARISQGGKNVSGGQKQRLTIARAIAKKPEILIFDDSFSALDYKTDKTLRSELKSELGDTTLLIVAQRIGTIKDADQIMVLDEGKVVGLGTHKSLLKTCDVYREIAHSQLSEEELNASKK